MGDRANVVFKQGKGYLGLYLHNGGYRVKSDVANTLQRVVDARRTSDDGYATRIAISNIIGNDWSQDYSYGLYAGATINDAIADNEHDIIVIDWEDGTVLLYDFDFGKWVIKDVKQTYTFDEFIKKFKQ